MAVIQEALSRNGVNVAPTQFKDPVILRQVDGGTCPAQVVLHDEAKSHLFTFTSSCGTGELVHGKVEIFYSPPSIGPTVRRAVASLR